MADKRSLAEEIILRLKKLQRTVDEVKAAQEKAAKNAKKDDDDLDDLDGDDL